MPASLNQSRLQFVSRHDLPVTSTEKPDALVARQMYEANLSIGNCLLFSRPSSYSGAEVSITNSSAGWKATNGNISIELDRSSGTVQLASLEAGRWHRMGHREAHHL